jgi:MYXO-CTERM domain-containing protein
MDPEDALMCTDALATGYFGAQLDDISERTRSFARAGFPCAEPGSGASQLPPEQETAMRKFLSAIGIAAALTMGPATAAVAQVDTPTVETDSGDDGSNAGLWGLLGLAGLAGLAGLKRRDRETGRSDYGASSQTRSNR